MARRSTNPLERLTEPKRPAWLTPLQVVAALSLLLALLYWGRGSTRALAAAKPKAQHCFFLIDRSGSMESLAEAVVDGVNGFVAKQAEMGEGMRLTLAQFHSGQPFELLIEEQEVTKVRPIKRRDFRPEGSTPLYDGIAELLAYADRATRPDEAVVVIVFSDGQENASRKHSRDQVFRLVEEHKERGWTFVFMGANQDSYAAGIGNSKGATMNIAATPAGVRAAFNDMESSNREMRKALKSGRTYTREERENYIQSRSAEAMLTTQQQRKPQSVRGGAS